MKSLAIVFFVILSIENSVSAPSIVCTHKNFPEKIGSHIEIEVNEYMEPTHLTITLNNKRNPSLNIKSMAHYHGRPTTTNENGTEINYFRWYASTHTKELENAIKDLPDHLVLYEFGKNISYRSKAYIGLIKWKKGSKTEIQETFECN